MSQVRALYGPLLFLPVTPPMLDINILLLILKANISLRDEFDIRAPALWICYGFTSLSPHTADCPPSPYGDEHFVKTRIMLS